MYTNQERNRLKELDVQLTQELRSMESSVLQMFSAEKGHPCSISSLHGTVGGKNNTYVDSIHAQFNDPNDFKARWINGFINYIGASRYSPLRNLMKRELFQKYTFTFLERNFYRNLLERTRRKPDESLWTVWFGGGKFTWGLIIAPVLRGNAWTNDVSEIRRAQYHYWTVGHVLATGLIDPENNKHYKFRDLDELLVFYESILKRISNSLYEKQIFDFYVEYLRSSRNPDLEPFLIPELRYLGLEVKHEHRLDFTILNSHTMEFVGFELSPKSTHMAVVGTKDKKQKEINAEINTMWEQEMVKRNKYFESYNITTVTFTDSLLSDPAKCFESMKNVLSRRPENKLELDTQIARLQNI